MEDVDHVVIVVCNEHDHIKGLFRKYQNPAASPEEKQKYVRELARDLTYHSLAEEEVLYPVVYEVLGEAAQEHAMDEHQSLKLLLGDLNTLEVTQPEYDATMHQLMEVFLDHIHEEEHLILLPLREQLDPEQLQQLGRAFLEAKQQILARHGGAGAELAPAGAASGEEADEGAEAAGAGGRSKPAWGPDQAHPGVAVA